MLARLIKITLICLAGLLVKKTVKLSVRGLRKTIKKAPLETTPRKKQRIKTINSLIVNTINLGINITIILLVLSELNINIMPLLAGVGILGLAVGFGARSLVADFIAGFFIFLENQYNLGDEVNLGTKLQGWQGKVIKISLRTTTLKDKEGQTYIIPNSAIKAVIIKPKNQS